MMLPVPAASRLIKAMSRATARLISDKTAESGSSAPKLRSLFASYMLINTKRDSVKELIIRAVEIKFDIFAADLFALTDAEI